MGPEDLCRRLNRETRGEEPYRLDHAPENPPCQCDHTSRFDSRSGDPDVKETRDDTSAAQPDSGKASNDDAERFFRALASNDPDKIEGVANLVETGTVAEAYMLHIQYSNMAAIDSGASSSPSEFSKSDEGYEACNTDDPEADNACITWWNIESKAGKIAKFTVNEEDLIERVSLGNGEAMDAGALGEVEFLTAYQSVQSGALFVSLRWNSAAKGVSLSDFYSATYRAPDGRQSTGGSGEWPLRSHSRFIRLRGRCFREGEAWRRNDRGGQRQRLRLD